MEKGTEDGSPPHQRWSCKWRRGMRRWPTVLSRKKDFDGDQMAVHVPLSADARSEARIYIR
ncbi:hypothetical protein Ccrd_008707 [Cynara cardunculus var. scolymus]|uniref:RNA polymerase alpha subunit domain-containing protein n=1 Tax=Cynara cardunculus var. scolymus TaxID=59895 RepID=A0A124SB25_CYNCS|nr:hypothetical protein Ccrd_008707 [Cynara cardunculus var. scolymus]